MSLTRTKFARLVRLSILSAVILIIIVYAVFRSMAYLRGPDIIIFEPLNGSTVASTSMIIIGRAIRVNSLSMNDAPIQVDEDGNFRETLIVFPGLNVITFRATDQFQRKAAEELRVYGYGAF